MTDTQKPPSPPKSRKRKPAATEDAPPRRRMRGFEPAATLIAPQLRRSAESRGFAVARLLTDWPEIVGAQTAAHTRPVKVSHSRTQGLGATLTILTDGAHAPLVQMELPRIRERVNAVYGFNAIARITVTQTAAQGFAEGQAQFLHRPPPPVEATPSPDALKQAETLASRFTDPGLAASIRRLALARAARGTPR